MAPLDLGTPRATRAFWTATSLMVVALFVPRLLPLVDYPQHLAVSEIARRLLLAEAPEHAQFNMDWFTYNALFHLLVSVLSFVVSTELAGRIVVGLAIVALALGTLVLLRALRRPPVHALLFVPLLFSFSLAWGFINYALGLAIMTFAVAAIARATARATLGTFVTTFALGLLSGFTHVLATLVLCAFAAALMPELVAQHATGTTPARRALDGLRRATLALTPLSGGALYCILVFLRQYRMSPGSYQDATLEGQAPSLLAKVAQFGGYASGVYLDQTDSVLVWVVVITMGFVARRAWRDRSAGSVVATSGPIGPLLAMTVAYFAIPAVFIGTHLVFPRLAQVALLGAVVWLPAIDGPARLRLEGIAATIAVVSGANLLVHSIWHSIETDAASRVIDALPPGRNVSAVLYDPSSRAFQCATLVHLAAIYRARKPGDFAFGFARFSSVPLDFKGNVPSWPSKGWEFAPADYNPRCRYARTYNVVVVAAPRRLADAGEAHIRSLIFKQDASVPKLLAREGRFLAFDTAGIPADGSL